MSDFDDIGQLAYRIMLVAAILAAVALVVVTVLVTRWVMS